MYCKNCGYDNPEGSGFCYKCGAPLQGNHNVCMNGKAKRQSKSILFVLSITLSVLGLLFSIFGPDSLKAQYSISIINIAFGIACSLGGFISSLFINNEAKATKTACIIIPSIATVINIYRLIELLIIML